MPINPSVCFVAACDICEYVYDHDNDEQTEEHFGSDEAARKQLAEDGWTVERDVTVCPSVVCHADARTSGLIA